jgi:hypothetical protein
MRQAALASSTPPPSARPATTSTLATTGVLFAYTTDTKILVTCTLQGSSSVAGTLDLYLQGFVN